MKRKFPITVKRGSVQIKVYRTASRGYVSYQVVYYDQGERKRETYADINEACQQADAIAEKLSRGEEWLLLRGEERMAYLVAVEMLSKQGLRLDTAAEEYVRASGALGNKASLMDAVTFYRKHHGDGIHPKLISEVVQELITAQTHQVSSADHISNLRSRLGRFSKSFQCNINDITAKEINEFITGLKVAPKTKNHFRDAIGNLINFARSQRYIPIDFQPLQFVSRVKEPGSEIKIYSPDELRLLIQHAWPEILPFVVMKAFGGFRTSELERMRWERDFSDDEIRVPPGSSHRVKSTRQVVIHPTLKAWLQVVRQNEGPVVPYASLSKQLLWLGEDAGVKHIQNGYRHSFATYRLKLTSNVYALSEDLGNSVRMIRRHYARPVNRDVAEAWFNIIPAQVKHVHSSRGLTGEQPQPQPTASAAPHGQEHPVAA